MQVVSTSLAGRFVQMAIVVLMSGLILVGAPHQTHNPLCGSRSAIVPGHRVGTLEIGMNPTQVWHILGTPTSSLVQRPNDRWFDIYVLPPAGRTILYYAHDVLSQAEIAPLRGSWAADCVLGTSLRPFLASKREVTDLLGQPDSEWLDDESTDTYLRYDQLGLEMAFDLTLVDFSIFTPTR